MSYPQSSTYLLWFSSTPTSLCPNSWVVDSPNTYHIQFECKVRFWCCWEASEEANRWWMQSNWIAWSGKAREDKGSTSQLVAGAWRARVHRVDWGWRDFCYSCTPTYSLVDQFIAWGTAKRFLIEFFGFLFDNTSRCYIVFVSFFSTLLALILLLIFDEYGLE